MLRRRNGSQFGDIAIQFCNRLLQSRSAPGTGQRMASLAQPVIRGLELTGLKAVPDQLQQAPHEFETFAQRMGIAA